MKPRAQLTSAIFGAGETVGQLDIRWEAADDNLTERPVTLSFAEQAAGAQDQDQNQQREGDRILIAGTNAANERDGRFGQPKDQATGQRTPGRAKPPQNDDDEGAQGKRTTF